jgi:hypothetical protein
LLQLAPPHGDRDKRFRIQNNLPGSRDFCPLIRMPPYLQGMLATDLRRAAAYFYLKETQSSFELEREKPSPQKTQRFADLLRQADTQTPLAEERLLDLQHAALDPRFTSSPGVASRTG